MDLTRRINKEETLRIEPCPVCFGEITVRDCGYSSFNPGSAVCNICQREWELDFVGDTWNAGIKWNDKARYIRERLDLLLMLTVNIPTSISRDYYLADKAKKAENLKEELAKMIIGAR